MATEHDGTTVEKDSGGVRDFRTVSLSPKRLQVNIGRERADGLEERTLSLHDTAGGVTLATEGVDKDAVEASGSLVELDAEQARLLADALYQAAAEQDGGDA